MNRLPKLTTNVFIWIVSGDYKDSWFRIIAEGYYDKILGDFVYKVEHSLGFIMFLSETELFDSSKYLIKDYFRRIS